MSDIAMCTGENCPKKRKCYRHTAPINIFWQAYSAFHLEPVCNYFIDNKDYGSNNDRRDTGDDK